MLQQLRITLRQLAKRPAFTLAAIGTLAVGIGATTAIFSTVNATILRPLPFPDPHEVYRVGTRFLDGRFSTGRLGGSHILEMNEVARTVEHSAHFTLGDGVLMVEGGAPRDILIARVGEGFFDVFRAPMAAGRTFTPEEATPIRQERTVQGPTGPQTVFTTSLPTIAVMSYRLWQDAFGGDPTLIDGTIRLRGQTITVVGVAPQGFEAPRGADLWMPTTTAAGRTVTLEGGYLRTVPGVDREALEADLATVAAGLVDRFPLFNGRTLYVTPINESLVGDLGPILLIVLAGAIVLLVIGCVNVATLLLARAAGQTKEIAVRAALGARRGQILGQFLTESFVLAAGGTLLGLFFAFAGIQLLLASGGAQLPRLDTVPFDGRVLLFVGGILALTIALVGVLPAVRLSNPGLRGLLGESGRTTTGGRGTRRLLGALVATEIALSIVLVAGAGWLVRSYSNLSRNDLGFTTEGRLLIDPLAPETTAALQNIQNRGLERLRGIAGVTAVGTGQLPLSRFTISGTYVGIPGETFDEARPDVTYGLTISEEFFEAMGTRLLAGRFLTNEDRIVLLIGRMNPATGLMEMGTLDGATGVFTPGQPTVPPIQKVVVNQAFVDRYLPNRDPVGATFAIGVPVNMSNLQEVVGVVETLKYESLQGELYPVYYTIGNVASRRWVVSTAMADPTPLIPEIRSALLEIEPSAQFNIEPLDTLVTDALWRHRLGLVLMVLFAVVSLGLAAIGIFGVIADATALRTRELATRMTLGATPGHVIGLLLNEGRVRSIAGVILGLGAAYAGGRFAGSRLYQVEASDPMVLATAVAAVLAVTLVAFFVPALRASRIAPAEALKSE